MKNKIVILMVLCFLGLTACTSQNAELNYDQELVSFLIDAPATYYGEGQYYHEIQTVEMTELPNQYKIVAMGEIQDNAIGNNQVDYTFSYKFLVNDQSVIQIIDNNRLNDSEFREIELLRKPIALGSTWRFDAVMFNNKTEKMTAEIIEINESHDEIKVRYTTKDYVEVRVIKKGLGVTDFTKEVAYKDVKAISGFHLEGEKKEILNDHFESDVNSEALQSEKEIFDDFIEVAITQVEHSLILGFNQNYEKKINQEEFDLSDYVMPESPASEKIDNLKNIDVGAFKFLEFKVKSKVTQGDSVVIEVMEMYDLGENQSILNTVTYTLKSYGEQLMIYDFE